MYAQSEQPHSGTLKPENVIRKRIRDDLPKDLLAPIPARAFWFLPLLAVIFAGWYLLATQDLGILASLGLAVLIGQCFGSLGFLSHEVSHGSIVKTPWLKKVLAGIGFSPFLVTPNFWHRWHNIVHHGNTNMGDKDPDSFGNQKRYLRNPSQKKLVKLAPGSGTWYSYLFLFYSFTLHSQAVLWLQTKHRKAFQGFDRKAAIRNMFLLLSGWIAFGIYLGPWASLFGLLLPMMLGNFVIQSYILTNHFLRPQAPTNNPIDNSMSVNTLKVLDRLHFHFSHHIEHHLFPTMPSCKAPQVRQWLLENVPKSYVSPAHWRAVYYLYKTPRVYASPATLVDVNKENAVFDLKAFQNTLLPDYISLDDWINNSNQAQQTY
jgi:fatty acid desaturase